jgi:hypothetical protein
MSKRKSVDLLPVIFRTEANTRFLSGTVDQLIQQPTLKKVDGFIGDKTVSNYNPTVDSYVNEGTSLRTSYELEPGIVIRNSVTDEVEYAKTYEDLLNSLQYLGTDISNQDKMFRQQSYAWNPQIDLDKFVNYRNYVWLPSGPLTIRVTGKEKEITSTIRVLFNGTDWKFSTDVVAVNPTTTLYRGMTYIFEVNSVDQPFWIKSKRSSGDVDAWPNVTNNGTVGGSVVFTVGENTPGTLFYVSGADNTIFGKFLVRDQVENTELNVETDVIGKKTYAIKDGVQLSNGMKISFADTVFPESYRNKTYIVEGVGSSITLVDYDKLVTIEQYSTVVETSFDLDAFDSLPFDEVSEYPVTPDYLLINRASQDLNPWSRYNRWFHIDVINTSAELNNVEPNFVASDRAQRPIIEFKPNIQLFNFANATKYVNFLDNTVLDAFSNIEGALGYYIDGKQLENGNRIVFVSEKDTNIKNKIYEVQFKDIDGVKKIHLEPATDSNPNINDGLLVLTGNTNGKTSWIYKNGEWVKSQQKDSLNQAPLFDIFDSAANSLGDTTVYKDTTFVGCKIFSYKIGTGANDTVLGFPLSYGNVSNVGGYLFDSALSTDEYQYFIDGQINMLNSRDGFIKINGEYVNGWTKCHKLSIQEIIDQKVAIGGETSLAFDSIDVRTTKAEVRVFKNGDLLPTSIYDIRVDTVFDSYFINFATALLAGDSITIKALPTYAKKTDGHYEAPINLVNNPLNEFPSELSYAEINDHLNSILLNGTRDLGTTLSQTNLRDVADVEKYGRRFVQHEGLVALAGALLTSKEYNFISAIRWGALEYQRYKTLVLQKFIELEPYKNISDALDAVILEISKDKTPASTFYYSDMLPYGLNKREYSYTVRDANIKSYAYGSELFNRYTLDKKAVLVYLNNILMVIDKDYTFDTVNPLVRFNTVINVGDSVNVKVYNNIYGSSMPMTPTKLGLYPSFEPSIYSDDTYIETTNVLQGHDGSITVCYGDDRDLLLLELETRIYNNLKVAYDPRVMDINDALPGMFRKTSHSIAQIDKSIEQEFLRWTGMFSIDYATNDNAEYDDSFGYNFVNASSILDENTILTGSWRKLYKHYFDTDRPHTHPWEMLGFFKKPTWWESEYGPSPYTSGNEILWNDLENGYIRQGDRQGYDSKYARPGLLSIIPVNEYGDLVDPLTVNVIESFEFADRYKDWSFGDVGPAEAAWRRSHLYPFAVQIAMALNIPAKYFTLGFDTSRNVFNNAGQVVYSDTAQRVSPSALKIVDGSTITGTGYHPIIVEHLRLRYQSPSTLLASYLNRLTSNLIYKVGGFTSKDKFGIALETVSSYKTVDKVFVPEENYQLVLSVGSPVKTLTMSGIIVERTNSGFVVKGYDSNNPYFTIKKAIERANDPVIIVGGTTEPFIYWAENATINGGVIVSVGQRYYRAISDHVTGGSFNSTLYYPLPYLPSVGGIQAIVPQVFEEVNTIVPYGTAFTSIQSVYNFILGYGQYCISQGFKFDSVLPELEIVANWELSGKEFLFWSIQNWASTSIISLAPFAGKVEFTSLDSVVEDVYDRFYDYTILKSDGTSIDKKKISIVREEGSFVIDTSSMANDGVYFVKITLVQKEHVVVFDNKTIFNDLVYQTVSGYRQRRFKVKGFMTDSWKGDFYIPGFVYDSAKIDEWQPNVDYGIGDVVKYQTKYYQANIPLVATSSFNYENWTLLGSKPVAQLLPNFEYKISQFEEFYSLDSVNFDNSQQKYAQKLIGYVSRNYLKSLIPDEASQYKFYQGFIREKGTAQTLEKFAVANNAATGSHIELQEEWAIRLGMFGGDNAYDEIEFTLDQNQFNQDPQIFQFAYGENTNVDSNAYVIPYDHMLIKPKDYDGSPWPILDVSKETGNGYLQYLKIPTAGYVRIDDVSFTGLYESNILSIASNGSLNEGDTIWLAMDNRGDWSVKRYTITAASVITYSVDNANNLINFITDVSHNLTLRDFVSIARLDDPLNGIYEVIGIPTDTSFIVKTTFNDISDASAVLNGSIYTFNTSRFSTLDDLSSMNGLARWQNCEFIWVDDIGDGTWAVYEKEDCTTATPLRPYIEQANQQFGSQVVIAPKSKNIIVSATELERGRVYVYERAAVGATVILLRQSYLLEENYSDELTVQTLRNGTVVEEMMRNHGASIDCWESDDLLTRYIVSGAPNSSNAKWNATGVTPTTLLKVLAFNYTPSTLIDEGAIKIVKFNTDDDLYETEIVLASPRTQAGALFGYEVKFIGTDKPTLLVSAPGQDSGVGAIFVYYLDLNNEWQVYTEINSAYNLRSEITSINTQANFGWDITSTTDGKTIVVSAPGYIKDKTQVHAGAVFVFTKDASTYGYSLTQSIYADDYLQSGDLILKGTVKIYDTVNQILTFRAEDNSLVRNVGNFITDGFRIGQTITVSGSASNNLQFVISELSDLRMGFQNFVSVDDETATATITITGQGTMRNDRFGDSVAMSGDGSVLIISSDHASQRKLDAGMIYILNKNANGQYTLIQNIESPAIESGELFGSNLSLSADGSTLLVTAIGGDQGTPVAFDTYAERYVESEAIYGSEYVLNPNSSLKPIRTTFDNGSTRFVSRANASGSVYMFQKMGTKYIFAQSLISGDSASADGYGTGIATNGEFCLVGAPKYDLKVISTVDATNQLIQYTNAGTVVVYDYKTAAGELRSWKKVREQSPMVDVDKIKKVISYNTDSLEILEQYEIFDPVKGKIPAKVMNEIKYVTPADPAVYTIAVQTSNKVRVDNKTTWTTDHIGELWLDTSTTRYVWYEQGSDEFRSNNWGKLFPGSTIDVYEWVQSDYRPSEWSQLADTAEGLALGISGQPKNPDNTVLSLNQYFDPVINDFVNVYFFWVRNKITIPDLNFRSISSFDCARIIEDPKLQGIKYVSFLSASSLSLSNTKKDLNADKINIDVYYQTSDNEVNRHSHWQLINENMTYLNIDPSVENKLIDSLVGQDVAGNIVPDPSLSPKLRYGNNIRPRQSWFKDRDLALKTMIQYVNSVLLLNDISGKVDLDNINVIDPIPTESAGHYDEIIDLASDISSVGANGKVQAQLTATVTNGKVVNVLITNPGSGYKIAPIVKVSGTGTGASIQTAIDLSGKVVGVKILSQGYGYDNAPRLYVRPYSVLTTLDEDIGKWAIYYFKDSAFQREISQTYDVTKYWNYIDWTSSDYTFDVPPKYSIGFLSDLELNTFVVGDTVEIRNTGDNRKIILRKTLANLGNYLNDFDLIYREKGTITFSNKLYDKNAAGIGYDNVASFDQAGFDASNSVELRKVLEAIKNDIFIGDLAVYWNKFIFVAIRHVLTEQLFVDWIYKTSFITPNIDAGTLDQKEIYRFNDFGYVEEFIKEVKPYKSKFRDVTVNYNTVETANISVTDFDLPAYVDPITGLVKVPEGLLLSNLYPYKHWNNNYSFGIASITVGSGGANYNIPPVVTIVSQIGDTGTGATAIAKISEGKLSSIEVTNAGTGYLKTPSVILTGGGNYDLNFVEGTAYAIMFNNKVRSNLVQFKFDRISEKGLFTGEVYNRNITTDGIGLNYVLAYPNFTSDDNYPALQDENTIKLFLNEAEISSDNYRIIFRTDLSTVITFNVALPANQQLRIQYIKNVLYTVDTFVQSSGGTFTDTFKLTFPPELDPLKIIAKLVNTSNGTGSEIAASDFILRVEQIKENGFTKYVGYIQFKTTPTAGSVITIQYAKNINIQNAVDRIITYYAPTSGMPGKDISQLMRGIDFGGVEIQGLNFAVSSGWDGLPWFTQGWDTFVNEYKDLLVISNGLTATYNLGYVPLLGTLINVYFDGVRVDDIDFGTVDQTNDNALFATIVANGSADTITLPVVPANGVKIEVRQSLSDGVNLPSDDYVLDTSLSGGDFSVVFDSGETKFRTATGIRADDISVDGGQFLSLEHSPATEELVKGEIFDTLSLTVFNSPGSGSNIITTNQFTIDGTNTEFVIPGVLDSNQQIDVYIGEFYANREGDYTITVNSNNTTTIDILTTEYGIPSASPTNKIVVTVQKIRIGGDQILDRINHIVTVAEATANIIEIETSINISDIGSYYISTSKPSTLTKLTGRSKRAKIVIQNTSVKLVAGTLITVLLFGSTIKTYSEVYNQEIAILNNTTYTLLRPPGNIAPLHVMAAVTRLTPAGENWRGSWVENIGYLVGDTILYGNTSYICKLAHLSVSATTSIVFPDWATTTAYNIGNVVEFLNKLYICKVNHTSNSVELIPTNTAYWNEHVTNKPNEDTAMVYWTTLPVQRLLPPETEYYEVTQNLQTFRLGDNIPYLTRTLSISDIEVYRNGKIMITGQDFEFDNINNTVSLSSGVAQVGDVIAICVLKNADYLIVGDSITFTAKAKIANGQKINVTTYTNHDQNLMRREVFKASPFKHDYKVSRPIYDIDNVWVDLNGRPLIPNFDFKVVDQYYIQLSSKFEFENNDRIVVTSISDIDHGHRVAYRMFKDMTNSVQFKRISKEGSVTLTKELLATDREIEVNDASIFGTVNVKDPKPSVIYIAGERIEFRSINNNVLGSLTRGTAGTGTSDSYPVGTTAFNFGQSETIPYREGFTIQTFKTPVGYRYNQSSGEYQQYVNNAWVNVDNVFTVTLANFMFNDTIALEDQVSIYLAGKALIKPTRSGNPLIKHNFSITLNSDELNSIDETGDVEVDPDFTITKVGANYILTINPSSLPYDSAGQVIPDVHVKVTQRIGKIWYTLNGNNTIQSESTAQAKFLQDSPAELPDKYYYGKTA